jgi:hypothetical protein
MDWDFNTGRGRAPFPFDSVGYRVDGDDLFYNQRRNGRDALPAGPFGRPFYTPPASRTVRFQDQSRFSELPQQQPLQQQLPMMTMTAPVAASAPVQPLPDPAATQLAGLQNILQR